MFKDDDDIEPLSTRKSLERADHGKQDRLDERKKMLSKDRNALKRNILRQNLPNAPGKDVEDEENMDPRTIASDERKQRATAAQRNVTERDLIGRHEEEERVKKEARPEEQQEIG